MMRIKGFPCSLTRGVLCLLALATMLSGCPAKGQAPDLFGIYTATLSGGKASRILADPDRQMTHVRVSPNHRLIAFTRYNRRGLNGLAEENDGYTETEIVVARIDGTGLRSIVPPKRGIIASNPSWSDDGESLFYVSTDTPDRSPQINTINLRSGQIKRVPTPYNMATTDPHHVGNRIVFPVKGKDTDAIWIMNLDGSQLRQLTWPSIPESTAKGAFHFGDYDPKLSSNGRRIAFMRYYGGESWRIFVADVESRREDMLTTPGETDGLPEWSSDGRLLLFWHLDRTNLRAMGIYTMTPDGSGRRMVPLPRGYLFSHASFYPGSGSGPDARIVYVAKKMPNLP